MPLTDEQKNHIASLKDADPADIAAELQSALQPAYQIIYRIGYGKAEGETRPKLKAVEREKEEALARIAEMEEQRATAPDINAFRQEAAERERKLKEKHDADLATERQARAKERTDRILSDLNAELVSAGVRPLIAKYMAREIMDERLRARDDGTLEYYEDGGQIPVALPAGTNPVKHAAKVAAENATPDDIVSNADRGAGMRGTGGGGGGGGYDPRAAGKAAAEQQKAQQADQSLALR